MSTYRKKAPALAWINVTCGGLARKEQTISLQRRFAASCWVGKTNPATIARPHPAGRNTIFCRQTKATGKGPKHDAKAHGYRSGKDCRIRPYRLLPHTGANRHRLRSLKVRHRLRNALLSNLEQTAGSEGTHLGSGCRHTRGAMSRLDQFWNYAREAMLAAGDAETVEDQQQLFALAQTWTAAALSEQQSGD